MKETIEQLWQKPVGEWNAEDDINLDLFLGMLDAGNIRSAEPSTAEETGWRVNTWVKQGILCGFRRGIIVPMSGQFFDKSTYPLKEMDGSVRVVPGGSSIRRGSFLAPGVVCMPPMYVNVGAYVGANTMIDSHALVGSCAQIGERVHLSAAAQIGGVLEPVGALPVIIEDDVLVGGNCGVYEGVVVKSRAVLGSGVILNSSTPIYDLVEDRVHRATESTPLIVPANAVVVAGSRAVTKGKGPEWGLSIYTPIIVKYRDEGTDTRVQLEDWLR
ncbi:MAG: 2,3,4,5-tetrahydropyridine-2,6-dicarboxylate N-succinyltransferase [Fimbriimonadaceae bacterium]